MEVHHGAITIRSLLGWHRSSYTAVHSCNSRRLRGTLSKCTISTCLTHSNRFHCRELSCGLLRQQNTDELITDDRGLQAGRKVYYFSARHPFIKIINDSDERSATSQLVSYLFKKYRHDQYIYICVGTRDCSEHGLKIVQTRWTIDRLDISNDSIHRTMSPLLLQRESRRRVQYVVRQWEARSRRIPDRTSQQETQITNTIPDGSQQRNTCLWVISSVNHNWITSFWLDFHSQEFVSQRIRKSEVRRPIQSFWWIYQAHEIRNSRFLFIGDSVRIDHMIVPPSIFYCLTDQSINDISKS